MVFLCRYLNEDKKKHLEQEVVDKFDVLEEKIWKMGRSRGVYKEKKSL